MVAIDAAAAGTFWRTNDAMTAAKIEFEVKLVGASADIAALACSPTLRALCDGEPAWERLVTTYFDTPARTLAKRGVTLRLRTDAAGLTQAIKVSRRGEGAVARLEDERRLGAASEFPAAPEDPRLLDLVGPLTGLVATSRTISDRWAAPLRKGRTRIEAALDLGRMEALDDGALARSAPLAEFELELIDGDAEKLFAIARRLIIESGGRLRPCALSKAEQARRLWAPLSTGSQTRIPLEPTAPAADVFALALRQSAARMIELIPSITEQRLPEGLHQMRVALRRFRTIERMFRRAVRDENIRNLARQARVFAAALAEAREWDVFIGKTLAPARKEAGQTEGFSILEARAAHLRAQSWAVAARTVSSPEFSVFTLDLLQAAHLRSWRKKARGALSRPAARFAAKALDRLWLAAHARAAARAPACRHRLRIALKKLRYGAQTFQALYPREARKPAMAALARLQDRLGALNDAVVAHSLADRAVAGKKASRAAGLIAGIGAAEAAVLSGQIDAEWAALAAETPFWRLP